MTVRDQHRYVNELDEERVQRLIARLESRGKDEVFTSLFEAYAGELGLERCQRVLEVGCGTGVVARALARRPEFAGQVVAVDHSPLFVDAARRLVSEEGLGDRIELRVEDAHALESADGSFDVAIAHTLISHVSEPMAVLGELARVVRGDGVVAIFDGDYASMTYAYPDEAVGRAMDEALARATFNNPLVMRELPRRLGEVGLELIRTVPAVVSEIGQASYFRSFAETYAPPVAEAGLLPRETVDAWLAEQRDAMERGEFFASCNYYAYLARRRGLPEST